MSSNSKFGMQWSLSATNAQGQTLTIAYPFTLEFNVVRNNYAATNTAQIRIMNLSTQSQNFFQHDQDDFSADHAIFVTLQAGYGTGPLWPVIFKGNLTRGYSVREGVQSVTNIEAFDGGLAVANGTSSQTFPAGTTQLAVIQSLVNDLGPYGVSMGAISNALGGVLSKGVAYSGNTLDILRDLTNGNYFIDNLTLNALVPGDALATNILTIDASSGLLGTPIKQQQYLELTTLFEPRLAIGSQVNLQASTNQTYNGVHQVISIQHRGIISAAVAGDATTVIGLQAGTFNAVAARAGI